MVYSLLCSYPSPASMAEMLASINDSLLIDHSDAYQTRGGLRVTTSGTLENAKELRNRLPNSPERNLAHDDTRVLALFVDFMRQQYFSMYETLHAVCEEIKGDISFLVSHSEQQYLYAVQRGQPLMVEQHAHSMAVTSVQDAHIPACERILSLEYGSIAFLNPDEVIITASADGGIIPPYWIPFLQAHEPDSSPGLAA